ncbi:MAG: type I-E CRISPR-associated endonuclease Cas1 [Herpetosiphonaceae bacterium]|nr:type I-E CRISPR-associated endonuclease Cas1 [Herpetosiphonaceae bacterium]
MSALNLRMLPKTRDSWTYLYAERCRIDQDEKAIALQDLKGKTAVPCASLTLLMLGPGTTITHAAVKTLAENGCTVIWTGEGGVRLYAQGLGETRSARRLLHQARLCTTPDLRLQVIRRMYEHRFPDALEPGLTLQQIRGKEGIRVRESYAAASRATSVPWNGREYKRDDWKSADPINRALSAANSCLYGVCHAGILAAGYSPGLGFIHTGKLLSFVYDVGDLYKAEITIPAAFQAVKEGEDGMEGRVRRTLRDRFKEQRLLMRIVDDIDHILDVGPLPENTAFDTDAAAPGELWDPELGGIPGGINQADTLGDV